MYTHCDLIVVPGKFNDTHGAAMTGHCIQVLLQYVQRSELVYFYCVVPASRAFYSVFLLCLYGRMLIDGNDILSIVPTGHDDDPIV